MPLSDYSPKEPSIQELYEDHISTGVNFDAFYDLPVYKSSSNVKRIEDIEESGLHAMLVRNFKKFPNRKKLTPIQRHAIPTIMEDYDLMACAPTGIGKTIDLSCVQFIVIDEADRMMKEDFLEDIEKLLRHPEMPLDRQMIMVSATFAKKLQAVAQSYLVQDYEFISVGETGMANMDITQRLIQISSNDKYETLKYLLKDDLEAVGCKDVDSGKWVKKTLVFIETRRQTCDITISLQEDGILCDYMNSDRSQSKRDEVFRKFKAGECPIMLATSVASRGLDIVNLAHVINYDLQREIDVYVQRIGRTARLGNRGKATSYYDPYNDYLLAPDLLHDGNWEE